MAREIQGKVKGLKTDQFKKKPDTMAEEETKEETSEEEKPEEKEEEETSEEKTE